MKFENFLRTKQGNKVEAAKALFRALRDERGIYLRFEALPSLFEIGNEPQQRKGFKEQPSLIRHYAMSNDLSHPEDILSHLEINGVDISCGDYLVEHPLDAHAINAKLTIRALEQRGIIKPGTNVYETIRNYFDYLKNNGINLHKSKFQDTLNPKRIKQLTDLTATAEIIADFDIFTSVCRGKWADVHPTHYRFNFGEHWVDDLGRKMEHKFSEKKYSKLSDGICYPCLDGMKIE